MQAQPYCHTPLAALILLRVSQKCWVTATSSTQTRQLGHSVSNVSLLRGGSPNVVLNLFLSILVQMLRFGAIFSPIGLILAEILFKMRFWPKISPKWENCDCSLNLRPNGLILSHNLSLSLYFDPKGIKLKLKSAKMAKNALFAIFWGHLNCLIAKMFR